MLGLYESALVVYATFHSYGNLVLFPYSYHIDALIVNHEENRALGEEFAAAVKAFSGTEYRVGSSAQILYTSNGNSKDYAGAAHSARISYTIELTGGGAAGFDLPATEIYNVVTETFEGVKVLAHFTGTAN
jgi:carboxypeptidase O